jgi:hypothetical protein
MTFILAVVLFVVVLGLADAGLPWPAARSKDERR